MGGGELSGPGSCLNPFLAPSFDWEETRDSLRTSKSVSNNLDCDSLSATGSDPCQDRSNGEMLLWHDMHLPTREPACAKVVPGTLTVTVCCVVSSKLHWNLHPNRNSLQLNTVERLLIENGMVYAACTEPVLQNLAWLPLEGLEVQEFPRSASLISALALCDPFDDPG